MMPKACIVMLLVTLLPATVVVRQSLAYENLYEGADLTWDSTSHDTNMVNNALPTAEPPHPGGLEHIIGAPSPLSIITSSPPLEDMCQPPNQMQNSSSKKPKKQRIKVVFVVVLPGLKNSTARQEFDEALVVEALQEASRAMGPQHEFDIQVKSVEYISVRARRRRRSMLQSRGADIKVTGEADFAGEDEMVASEIVQLLTDSPSSIFPEAEFGPVQVPEATMLEITGTHLVLPVAGAIGGLACLVAILSVYIWRGRRLRKTCTPDFALHHLDEGFIPEAKLQSTSQASLLSSISSKNYGQASSMPVAREKEYNNLGYY